MRFIVLFIFLVAFSRPVLGNELSYDTIRLVNGNTLYGKVTAHPTQENKTVVNFSNGGWLVLKNQEIRIVLTNTSAKDQFSRANTDT